ncbi:MAG: TrkH family potassium uptake protein [Thermoplasmata archaeon]|nr:MAG: TrkH family potassium uptake protein [Thermoplasmata archaeon]
MRLKVVIGAIGTIIKFFSFAFLIPTIPALYFWEIESTLTYVHIPFNLVVFLFCFGLTLLSGFLLEFIGSKEDFTDKEGFAIVSGGWLVVAFFASLPFVLTETLPNFVDGYFEAMSGLTTTGATVLPYPLEDHPQSVLFWRALLQWLGGMGIIVLSVAVLIRLTRGGLRLIEAEAPGPSLHKLKPTIMQTAKLLWLVYVFFTIAEVIALLLLGVPLYEAVYHAFTTMSTGGFSIHTDSIGHYSAPVHWLIIVFMIIAGTNFTLHYYALQGKGREYLRDPEFRFYLGMIGIAGVLIFLNQLAAGSATGDTASESAFQTVSIMTTTGYTTADYDTWPSFSRFLLLMLMFMGGCAASTSGAMKQVRMLLLLKMLKKKLMQLLNPHAVMPVRLGKTVVSDQDLHTITMFFFAYILIFILCTAAMLALGLDMITGASATASCLGNVGPALGGVGPSYSYASVPTTGKVILVVCMWLGRLEIFTALILFVPTAYKREAFLE